MSVIQIRNHLKKSFAEDLDEVAMYKLDEAAIQAMKKLVNENLQFFDSMNRI